MSVGPKYNLPDSDALPCSWGQCTEDADQTESNHSYADKYKKQHSHDNRIVAYQTESLDQPTFGVDTSPSTITSTQARPTVYQVFPSALNSQQQLQNYYPQKSSSTIFHGVTPSLRIGSPLEQSQIISQHCSIVPLTLLLSTDMDALKAVSHQINSFSVSLLANIESSNDPNIIVCPQGQVSVLAMLIEGTAGKTKEDLSTAISWGTKLDQLTERLTTYFSSQSITETGIASINFLVSSTDSPFTSSYTQKMLSYKNTLCYAFNEIDRAMNTETLRERINSRVKQLTANKVPTALDEDTLCDSGITVGNICCFVGFWKVSFSAFDGYFNFSKTESKKVPMLKCTGQHLRYALNLRGWSVCKIPYQGCFEMLIAQPNSECSQVLSSEIIKEFSDDSKFKKHEKFTLTMPKFVVESETDLLPAMRQSALSSLFVKGAEYSQMTASTNMEITTFLQKTLFIVNEKGSFGQAVTSCIKSKGPSAPHDFIHIDSPFAFAVRDTQTGLMLYSGMINSPVAPTPEQEALIS
ncbi:serpin family protein [Shewanella sp. 202IG2-18]|uniref:serpin family protein n=1 Tax=Parashewanella hymeniacidonis TaxID=2807618 RepID=UPI00195FF972|nr:serpin family protein [Parashewanella hymeniacidonis]MBM7074655.1 serpin family protein [Parashewanella hymeniacidonis]